MSEDRHGEVADVRSGGSFADDRATSAMRHAVRGAGLIEAIGFESDPDRPRRVLDAGCGSGYLARLLVEFGHQVDGIDTNTAAITECRRLAVGSETYSVSCLQGWRPPHLYDAVVCIDVMSHLVDDDEWLLGLRNLAGLVRLGGRLVVADHDAENDQDAEDDHDAKRTIVRGDQLKARDRSRYLKVLREQGMEPVSFIPNNFKADHVGFHVAIRVA